MWIETLVQTQAHIGTQIVENHIEEAAFEDFASDRFDSSAFELIQLINNNLQYIINANKLCFQIIRIAQC